MLTKTLSESKKKQRNILIKAMNNDIGSIDSSKDSWNPAQISERAKDISYIRSLVDTWNPAQLNEALKMLDLPVIDTWNPAQIEEQRRNLVFYLSERTLTGNPITLKILGNLTPEVTGLKVTMNPIQDLHGYSNPWVGGAGKNKIDKDTITKLIRSGSETASGISNIDGVLTITYAYGSGSYYLSQVLPITSGTITISADFMISGSSSHKTVRTMVGNNTASGAATDTANKLIDLTDEDTWERHSVSYELNNGASNGINIALQPWYADTSLKIKNLMVEIGSSMTDFAPYSNICPISGRTEASVTRTAGEDVETKTHEYSETIYGGVDDFVNGGLSNEWEYIASYAGETLPGEWISDRDVYAPGTTPTAGAEVAYKLATPTTIETTSENITLIKGTNVLSTDGDSIELKYKQNF